MFLLYIIYNIGVKLMVLLLVNFEYKFENIFYFRYKFEYFHVRFDRILKVLLLRYVFSTFDFIIVIFVVEIRRINFDYHILHYWNISTVYYRYFPYCCHYHYYSKHIYHSNLYLSGVFNIISMIIF